MIAKTFLPTSLALEKLDEGKNSLASCTHQADIEDSSDLSFQIN